MLHRESGLLDARARARACVYVCVSRLSALVCVHTDV